MFSLRYLLSAIPFVLLHQHDARLISGVRTSDGKYIPGFSTSQLASFTSHPNVMIRELLAASPACGFEGKAIGPQLLNDPYPQVRLAVVMNDAVDASLFYQLEHKEQNQGVLLALACRLDVQQSTLNWVAIAGDAWARYMVATHPSASGSILDLLSGDEEDEVLLAVSRHQATHQQTIKRIRSCVTSKPIRNDIQELILVNTKYRLTPL